MSEKINQRRRVMLAGVTAVLGGNVANQLLDQKGFMVAMAYAKNDHDQAAKIFSPRQLLVLRQICQIIIPRTETEGAGDVGTHRFIDNQLHHCFVTEQQDSLAALVSKIDKRAYDEFDQGFVELPLSQATQLLSAIDSGADQSDGIETSNFKFLKYLIVFGYYTTEIGASEELRYDQVPGGFKAKIPLQDVGSAWGALAFF